MYQTVMVSPITMNIKNNDDDDDDDDLKSGPYLETLTSSCVLALFIALGQKKNIKNNIILMKFHNTESISQELFTHLVASWRSSLNVSSPTPFTIIT